MDSQLLEKFKVGALVTGKDCIFTDLIETLDFVVIVKHLDYTEVPEILFREYDRDPEALYFEDQASEIWQVTSQTKDNWFTPQDVRQALDLLLQTKIEEAQKEAKEAILKS